MGDALSMDGVEVKDSVSFNDGFRATGQVSLPNATIGGQLRLALRCADLLTDGMRFDLRETQIGTVVLFESESGKPEKIATVLLLGAKYEDLYVIGEMTRASSEIGAWPRKGWAALRGESRLMDGPGRIYLEMLASQESDPTNSALSPATYDSMARILRHAGEETLSQQLLVAKHRAQRRKGKPGVTRFGSWVFDLSVGYGYRPRLAPMWALAAYVLSVLGLWIAVHHNGIVASPLPGIIGTPSPLRNSSSGPAFSAWNYALGSLLLPFVHIPGLDGVDAWRANAVNGWGTLVRIIRWVEPAVLLGLLLTLGATITRLLTRDRD